MRPGGSVTLRRVIPLDEARQHVLAACPRLPVVTVPLGEALGHVTAEDLGAAEDVPPFENSAVDGYAVRVADTERTPVELEVAGTIAAGAPPSIPVEPGRAVRIMTGAPLPAGAEAVVMVEDTTALDGGDRVRIERSVAFGDAVRHTGDDVHRGDLLFPAGTEIRPAVLGVLASVGHLTVPVVSRARVGALSTGRRADRGRLGAGAGPDPREQPDDAARRARPGRLHPDRPRPRP